MSRWVLSLGWRVWMVWVGVCAIVIEGVGRAPRSAVAGVGQSCFAWLNWLVRLGWPETWKTTFTVGSALLWCSRNAD